MGVYKKSRSKVILIAQEIELARELASNNKATRDKALKKLKKWFTSRSQGIHKFEKNDFLRIWKGLFYCMWMSDKPLVQEELAQEISNLVHSLVTVSAALKFVQAGFSALSIEWFGIDDLRINKFMMLIRRIVRQSFSLIEKTLWDEEDVKTCADMYYSVLTETNSLGLKLHLIEIYCEELAKIGKESLPADAVSSLITPFAKCMASSKDGRLISHITRHVFLHLIHQSEAGIEFDSKFNAWKQLGFPGGSIDALQRVDAEESDRDDNEDELSQNELDPRAGRVNVELPSLLFEPESFVSMLADLKTSQDTTAKARKTINSLIQKFEKLSEGKFPLGIHEVDLPEEKVPLKKEIIHKSKQMLKRKLSKYKVNTEDKLNEETRTCKVKTIHKSKKPVPQLKWNVTEAKNKENISVPKQTNNWEVEPSPKKMKCDIQNADKSQTKQQAVNTFKISETETKVNKFKVNKNIESELNKNRNKKVIGNQAGVKKPAKKKNKEDNTGDSFSTTGANDWGKEWETGLQEGETEIYIPSKKYLQKLLQDGGSAAKLALLRQHLGESKESILNPFALSPRSKKVEFALSLNTSQGRLSHDFAT